MGKFLAVLLLVVALSTVPVARADVIDTFTLTGTLIDTPSGTFQLDITTKSYVPASVTGLLGTFVSLDFAGSTIEFSDSDGGHLLGSTDLNFSSSCPGGFDTCPSVGIYLGTGLSADPANPAVAAATAAALGVLTPAPTPLLGSYVASVPEPGTTLLLGMGLICIAGTVYHKRRLQGRS